MIDTAQIVAMIEHWLTTPPNGYFGSSYGADLSSLLLRPLSVEVADRFIAKMRIDLPVVNRLSAEELGIYEAAQGFERKIIVLQVGNIGIDLTAMYDNMSSNQGEFYNVGAS